MLLISAVSCQSGTNYDKLSYTCDIESMVPFMDNRTIQKYEHAHTGSYVSIADSAYPYSVGFKIKVSDLTDGQLLRAEYTAWVKFSSENGAGKFVCVVDSQPGKNFIYMDDDIKCNRTKWATWQRCTSLFYLPRTLKPYYYIYLFLYNKNGGEIYLDDISIKFTEYGKDE